MKLSELTRFIDDYLSISECPDISLNGLQVEGKPEVQKIALAVDACSETFIKAASLKADILITHHGIFWGKQFPITGMNADRIKTLIKNGISLYAAHLPLDIHPESGNNAGLIDELGLEKGEPFGEYKGILVGMTGICPEQIEYNAFLSKLSGWLKNKPVAYKFGKDIIKKICVISGGGASCIDQTSGTDIDLFLTGELSHSSYHLAKELNLNLVFCGHYATETLGVKRLGGVIENKFGLETVFIDVPTGM
jgi:dinuclear metal center YbgI/SA1388 family protein